MSGRRSFRPHGFDPEAATDGAVTAWLRNSTLSGNISSIDDLLNVNPAVQTVDARRPSGNTDGSVTYADNPDNLVWPITSDNHGTSQTGFAFWFDPDSIAGATVLLEMSAVAGGASVNTLSIQTSGARLAIIVYDPDVGGANGRIGQSPAASLVAAPQFITFEFDGTAATEAGQFVITIAGLPVTVSFSNLGVPTTPIDTLAAPTGNIIIGNGQNAAAGSGPFAGRFSKNVLYRIGSKMSAATTGLLSTSARNALMNADVLT
jgi:hypothetical protein